MRCGNYGEEMRLILIRHGDPDYERDSLTQKGWREAELLAKRVRNWKVDDVFVSPLGRARDTAQSCLKEWGKQAEILPWAREFVYGDKILWDYFPADWTDKDENFCESAWTGLSNVDEKSRKAYRNVCCELDAFLLKYGYEREGRFYRVKKHSDKTIVVFCHFGVSMIFLSHLINISAEALLHGVFLPPTSVTVLNSEERRGDEAYFRIERLGDCHHLISGGEPVSKSGYFAEIMQEVVQKEE